MKHRDSVEINSLTQKGTECANKAVFIDRDGTMIDDYGYIKDPGKVEILDGVKTAIELLRANILWSL